MLCESDTPSVIIFIVIDTNPSKDRWKDSSRDGWEEEQVREVGGTGDRQGAEKSERVRGERTGNVHRATEDE